MSEPITGVGVTSRFEFNYAELSLEPYAGKTGDSSQLLKQLIFKFSDPEWQQRNQIIDRYKNRKDSESRFLVHISSSLEKAGGRCFGKIALIKNKDPMFWGGKDIVEEIEKSENRRFIELTNYSINFNLNSNPMLMLEFNSAGPRLSDFEYYFRQMLTETKIAKSIKSKLILDVDFGDLSSNIDNVFSIDVKVPANEIHSKDKKDWHKSLIALEEETGFRDVKMKMFYRRELDGNGKFIKNVVGLGYVRKILDWLQKDKNNIDQIEDLKVEFQANGEEQIRELDFLKNKTTSVIFIPLFAGKVRPIDYKAFVNNEFNEYLLTGKTSKE